MCVCVGMDACACACLRRYVCLLKVSRAICSHHLCVFVSSSFAQELALAHVVCSSPFSSSSSLYSSPLSVSSYFSHLLSLPLLSLSLLLRFSLFSSLLRRQGQGGPRLRQQRQVGVWFVSLCFWIDFLFFFLLSCFDVSSSS